MPTPKPGIYAHPAQRGAEFFQGKETSFDYRDVWREEHALGFTGAKAVQLDVLRTIRNALSEALAGGQTFRAFQKNLTPTLQKKGWWGVKQKKDSKTTLVARGKSGYALAAHGTCASSFGQTPAHPTPRGSGNAASATKPPTPT